MNKLGIKASNFASSNQARGREVTQRNPREAHKSHLRGSVFNKLTRFAQSHACPAAAGYPQPNHEIDRGSSPLQTDGNSGELVSFSPTFPGPDKRANDAQASSSTDITPTSPSILYKAREQGAITQSQSTCTEVLSISNTASTASAASSSSSCNPACGEISVLDADRSKIFKLGQIKVLPVHENNPSTSHYLTQLSTLFHEGKLQVSFRAIEGLLKKPQKNRTLQDLRNAALLDPAQLELAESQTLSTAQLRYLTSNGVILSLAQGRRANLVAFSHISDNYIGTQRFDKNGIFEAIYNNAHNVNVIDDMVKSNLFIAVTDPYGNTSLHHAVKHSLAQCVKVLLARGADPNAKNIYGDAPLHYAKNLNIVKSLLTYGADPNVQNKQRKTPLHQVADSLNTEVAHTLLKHGADPDKCDEAGNTSLYWVHKPT